VVDEPSRKRGKGTDRMSWTQEKDDLLVTLFELAKRTGLVSVENTLQRKGWNQLADSFRERTGDQGVDGNKY
jgi:hypothetical protein